MTRPDGRAALPEIIDARVVELRFLVFNDAAAEGQDARSPTIVIDRRP